MPNNKPEAQKTTLGDNYLYKVKNAEISYKISGTAKALIEKIETRMTLYRARNSFLSWLIGFISKTNRGLKHLKLHRICWVKLKISPFPA